MSARYVMSLNNYLQGQSNDETTALVWEVSSSGPPHELSWVATCKLHGKVLGSASASQKAAAKEQAAKQALEALGVAI